MEFDRQSISSIGSRQHAFERPGSDIKMTGYLKKLKTMKKKYFVLRCTSSSGPARMEYYDSEKKFKSGHLPKRSIHLHTCFNINKKSDSRHGKYGVALYANEECFTILAESEKEQEAWLSTLLEYQNEYLPDGDMHKEHYDHVWQVTLQSRGLGQGQASKGHYRLCLNNSTVSLVKTNSSMPQFTIQLVTIRTVAHHDNSFRLEVGNYAPTGAGEFWFTVEDGNISKDMHETLLQYMNAIVKDPSLRRDQQSVHLRAKRDIHSTYCPANSLDAHSPGSPNYSVEYPGVSHRLRSDSRTSRSSKTSFHEDLSPGFMTAYNGDHLEVMMREHNTIVPPDMSPPPSPGCLDDQINAYFAMDMEKQRQRSSITSVTSNSTQSSNYLPMSSDNHRSTNPGDLVSPSSYTDESSAGYMAMAGHHGSTSSHPVPIHMHSFSEPLHTTHLPTVREGGSNEGYLPMDMPSSPASSSGVPKPEPAVCMLSDGSTGLPPRTYSLGSKPTKKFSGYMDMAPKKSAGNDMSRATSAPQILKGRREPEQRTTSPTPSASPLSMSLKSDDSDSFMEYVPMRPRTASDSFNYRNRTSSFGKLQQSCRPRSSSHGQGTRPVINFSKLSVEKSRISKEAVQRASRESSLQGSFDSLRISNESLRRMSQEMRQTSGSNASDYLEMRDTPSPRTKSMRSVDTDGYINIQVGTGGRRSPHRTRTDSSGSGRADVKTSSSDRLHQTSSHLQQITDYTEMAPLNAGGNGKSYMNMDYNSRHGSNIDSKSAHSASIIHYSNHEGPRYMNVNLDDKSKNQDGSRSLSMENVDTYVMYDPHSGNKPRTGSLGSKDPTITRPGSTRKSSSASVSSASSPSSSGIIHNQTSVSTSTRSGGSSDSIRKTSRQSSSEKYGSLGKDFRKKSGSTGSRPSTGKNIFGISVSKDGSGIIPARRPSSTKLPKDDPEADEYIEFLPTAAKIDNHHHHSQSSFTHSGAPHSNMPLPSSGRSGSSLSSGSFSSSRSNPTPSPADDEAYTLYSPAAPQATKSVHFHQHEPHSHNHPPHTKYGTSPSSSSSVHSNQVTSKDITEYVDFEPGIRPNSSQTSSNVFSNVKQVEAKDIPQYVGFEPGLKPFSAPSIPPSSLPKLIVQKNQEDYIPYKPGTASRSSKPITPNSAVSYIQSSDLIGSDKTKQPYVFLDSNLTLNKQDRHSASINPHPYTHINPLSQPGSSVALSQVPSVIPSQIPPVPLLSSNSSLQSHSVAKPAVQDVTEYLKNSLAGSSDLGLSQQKTVSTKNSPASFLSENAKSQSNSFPPASPRSQPDSFPLASLRSQPDSFPPASPRSQPDNFPPASPRSQPDSFPLASPRSQTDSFPPASPKSQPDNCPPASLRSQLTQLFIDVGEESRKSPVVFKGSNIGNSPREPNKPKLQQQSHKLQQPPQNFQRQLSAPASQSSQVSASNILGQYQQPLSPHNLSSSYILESPSPTDSGRQKHWSGSSNSSQKSNRSSSDSEKTFRKGNKSDASVISAGGKSKRRILSYKESPEGCSEENLHQRRGNGGSTSTASLEAKIIPVEAKIRHSIGDVNCAVGKYTKEQQEHHSLIRPDSTPCIQNLSPSTDPGSRSVGDTPISTPRSGSVQFSVGPRSRHSLSDLGAYQQMSFTPSGLAPFSSNPGSRGVDSSSGINDSNIYAHTPKPLNYVKLDLGCLEVQGDADTKSCRVKSRHMSDTDEKSLPLSYAEIDFVKSQNWNKTLSSGISGENTSSKT